VIESVAAADDPRIAEYARVGDAGWLRERGRFVAEGRLVVRRLVGAPRHTIRSILITPAALEALRDVVETVTCPVYVCDQRTMDTVGGFNFHRGCLALAHRPPDQPIESLESASRLLALEGVGNPDNVGGLFRVAGAFDVRGVLLDPASGDPLYRKSIRTSMGAALSTPFARVARWPADLARFRAAGFTILALTPQPDAVPLASYATTVPPHARLLLLVGSEGAGLSRSAFDMADHRVRIPISSGVDSLNVVVAAGIALAILGPG
jgi:tRNA G18 (ribose-2'-O)-methylase SpoU